MLLEAGDWEELGELQRVANANPEEPRLQIGVSRLETIAANFK